MLLQFQNQATFATGMSFYAYQPVSDFEDSPRIILHIALNDWETLAFVDTGGINLICSPQVASRLALYPEDNVGSMRLLFRGAFYHGHLHPISLKFIAQHGHDLTVEVIAFVPSTEDLKWWPTEFPCVLGMSGCLERLRFAIDPETDTFYFGALGEVN